MSRTTKPADPRAERLRAALRENLRRRKAQIRERSRIDAGDAPRESGEQPEPAPVPDPDEPS